MSDHDALRKHLDEAMDQLGLWPARSPWTRQAVADTPRHAFAPDRLWRWDGHTYQPLDRGTDPDRWAAEVYGRPYDAAVTQITDGAPSSSLSCPSIVVDMLDSLMLEPGHRVLELGAGTGWNAALLTWRAGPGRVVSVEVDDELARQAEERLDAADTDVAVVAADGAGGWPPGAPYDRVVSTYAVDQVPWAWVEQTRPGGRIVTPWGRLGHVALTIADDHRSAVGWMQGLAMFMPARGTPPASRWPHVRGTGPADDERPFARDLRPLKDDAHLLFAPRIHLPDVQISTGVDDDGVNVWLHDGAASWATLTTLPDGEARACQGGPRRLADELEPAWDWWLAEGQPTLYDFGMTVGPEHQYVWCRDPATGPRWRLQAHGRAVV
ncbi:methyltransferase domain-containing protein [Streptomyces sp. NPDC021218]|uniref:methyltransferase domain-containing protein n=1 Tax=Streptomyces sp. NPDC021218 TaxID=3365119 RepID=UPI003794DD49